MYASRCPCVLQRDFAVTQCHVCGMVYSKGQPADEKIHKQQHQVFELGLSLQVGSERGSHVTST